MALYKRKLNRRQLREYTPAWLLEHIDDYLASLQNAGTEAMYEGAIMEFLGEVETLQHLKRLDQRHVVAWRKQMIAERKARATINRKLSAVRCFFDYLVSQNILDKNPAHSKVVKGLKRSGATRTKGLSVTDAEDLLAACDDGTLAGARDRAIIMFGLIQALRRSEIAGLRADSIQLQEETPVLVLRDTKTEDYATAVVDGRVLKALDDYLEQLDRELKPEDPLFFSVSTNGRGNGSELKPLNAKSINRIVKKRALAAGLKHRITSHSMRHTSCTLALDGGVKVEQVQAHMRHKDIRMTMWYYRNLQKLRTDATAAIKIEEKKRPRNK